MSKEEENNNDGTDRYENYQPKDFEPTFGNDENIEAISDHIEEHVGEIQFVYHEILSHLVHIDVHCLKATKERPFHAFITSGMSDRAMKIPEDVDITAYMEFCVLLPESWQFNWENTNEFSDDESSFWPIQWLKFLARFPHEFDTFFDRGHTIPNGEDAEPFAENTKLGCWMILPPVDLPEGFSQLKINENKTIHFNCIAPIYKEEMDFKLKKGAGALFEKFDEANISGIIDLNRVNTCKKRGLFGWW